MFDYLTPLGTGTLSGHEGIPDLCGLYSPREQHGYPIVLQLLA